MYLGKYLYKIYFIRILDLLAWQLVHFLWSSIASKWNGLYLHVYLGILQGYMVLSQNENLPVLYMYCTIHVDLDLLRVYARQGPVQKKQVETTNKIFLCPGVKCASRPK